MNRCYLNNKANLMRGWDWIESKSGWPRPARVIVYVKREENQPDFILDERHEGVNACVLIRRILGQEMRSLSHHGSQAISHDYNETPSPLRENVGDEGEDHQGLGIRHPGSCISRVPIGMYESGPISCPRLQIVLRKILANPYRPTRACNK
jgi:hypothetical protein